MSEKIKLKVPAGVDYEHISQGNHGVDVVAGEEVEVEDRRFADWLVREQGYTEITERARAPRGKNTPADETAKGGSE